MTFTYTVAVAWADKYSRDGCPDIIMAGFKLYNEATKYASEKLAYYSQFATTVEITVYRNNEPIKSLTYG